MLLDGTILPKQTTSCSWVLIDFSSFDKILVHLKLQTCFVLPGLISAITDCTDESRMSPTNKCHGCVCLLYHLTYESTRNLENCMVYMYIKVYRFA